MTRRQRVTFGSAAGIPLAGWLDLPDGDPTAVALFAHCFTCGEDGHAPARIARGLTDRGIAVLRFDFTGPGESAGESAAATFSSSIEDPVALPPDRPALIRERETGRIIVDESCHLRNAVR